MLASRALLVYGATGFTASLILPKLQELGVPFMLGGRDEAKLAGLAARLGVPYRAFDLSVPGRVDENLAGVRLLLNAAGPYVFTAEPLIDACLRRRVDYLDLSGEVDPLMYAERCDRFARSQGVMLLPAVGFDVVPSDCLAVYLSERLPGADSLALCLAPSNLISRGSLSTLVAQAGIPVKVLRAGRLQELRFRTQTRRVDFGFGERSVVAVTWGDLVTAHRSTGIANIEVYFEATAFRWLLVLANQYFGWWLETPPARTWMRNLVELAPSGPWEHQRAAQRSIIFGEVSNGERRVRACLKTPEAYSLTADAAALSIEAVLKGQRRAGFCTPGQLFGSEFALSLPGVTREDLV